MIATVITVQAALSVFTRHQLRDIPTHVKNLKGDTIVTNAFSAIFPENVMIGFIDGFEIKPGDNFYTISVRFSTNFKNVAHVFV